MHRNSDVLCHPVAQHTYADIEHIFPKVRCGAPRDPVNLIASCYTCDRRLKGMKVACERGWESCSTISRYQKDRTAVRLHLFGLAGAGFSRMRLVPVFPDSHDAS